MDTNMTFRMDSDVKAQMSAICKELGMTTSTAFNLFANAFVRAKGCPFLFSSRKPRAHRPAPRCWPMRTRFWINTWKTTGGWRNDLGDGRGCDCPPFPCD